MVWYITAGALVMLTIGILVMFLGNSLLAVLLICFSFPTLGIAAILYEMRLRR